MKLSLVISIKELLGNLKELRSERNDMLTKINNLEVELEELGSNLVVRVLQVQLSPCLNPGIRTHVKHFDLH